MWPRLKLLRHCFVDYPLIVADLFRRSLAIVAMVKLPLKVVLVVS